MKWILRGARLGVLALLLLWPCLAAALDLAETPRMRRLGVAEGLPSRTVLALAQDRHGYVWAATDDGLARYDGTHLRVWRHDPQVSGSLPGNTLETMLIDSRDRVWVGANGAGLAMLDANRQRFTRFAELEAICKHQVWALATQGTDLWVGTSGSGICLLHADGRISRYQHRPDDPRSLPDDTIYALLPGKDGSIWIGTTSGLVRWRPGAGFASVRSPLLQGKDVIRLSGDRDGGIWVGTDEGLYRVMDDGAVSPAPWPQAAQTRAAVVLHDRDGRYWMGSSNGLYRGDAQRLQLLEGDGGSGFLTGSSGVLDLLQDHEGGIWTALLTQGMAYLRPDWSRFSSHYQLDGKSLESLYLINSAADGNGFLVVGGHGLYQLDAAGKLSQLAGEAQLGPGSIWSVQRGSDGVIWLGRAGGITLYRPSDGQVRRINLGVGDDPTQRADLMRLAADGSMWLSIINYGLQHRAADGRLLAAYPQGTASGLPEKLVEQLRLGTDGSLWLVGGAGVQRFDGKRFVSVAGVSEGMVYDLVFLADGSAWLARDGALERYRHDASGFSLQQRLGTDDGVPAAAIGGLVAGCSGQLWATTTRGLLWWQPGAARVRVLEEGDGLTDTEFTARPPAHAGCGRALAVSATGLLSFNPDAKVAAPVGSQLVIESIGVRRDDAAREPGEAPDVWIVEDVAAYADEGEAAVHAVHGAADVAGALPCQERVEGDEGLGLAPRGVEEGSGEDVHALDVGARGAVGGLLRGVAGQARAGHGGPARRHRELLLLLLLLLLRGLVVPGVVQLPGDGVEQPDQAGLADPSAEEGVGGEGSERVVADLGVGGRGSSVDQGEVVVRGHDGCVEKDEPDVYPNSRLFFVSTDEWVSFLP